MKDATIIKMEKAVLVGNSPRIKKINEEFDRLYFGNEFCQNKIPTIAEIKAAKDFCNKKNKKFTLITPYVTDYGLNKIKELVSYLDKDDEIVVNDYGVLSYLGSNYSFRLVFGRLLNKLNRGPRIMNFIDSLPSDELYYHKTSNIDASHFNEFLTENNVNRIEFDNLLQGIINNSKFSGSLYLPFAYVTTTRMCLFNSFKEDMIGIYSCKHDCRRTETMLKLKHQDMPVELLLKGNAIFFENRKMPADLEKNKIDRIVFQPEIPI